MEENNEQSPETRPEEPRHQDLDISCFGVKPKAEKSAGTKAMEECCKNDKCFAAFVRRKRLKRDVRYE
jgi:hypothetical protein